MTKLKEILFDEEEVEIPVITKEEPEKKKSSKKADDEVIVHKIENLNDEEDLFDMPKLKEEAEEEVRTSTFTFPIFEDEELELKETRRTDKKKNNYKEEEPKKNNYSRSYDYLSSTDYKPSNSYYNSSSTKTTVTTEAKKPFTPSPIISPVYGILNENYKKEDIVTRSEATTRLSAEKIDLDSVRKKAYGTLEDEIEASLVTPKDTSDVLDEVPTKEELTLEDLSDDGLMITDLLMDEETTELNIDDYEEELFEIEEENVEEEIELDDEESVSEEVEKKNEAIGEDDLFDLIDSLYAGKGEN